MQETYRKFDVIKSTYMRVDVLVNERNKKINDFMDSLRDLEKERTALIEGCYKRHMIDIKQLPGDSFERLYEKYLKVNR